MQLFHTKLLFLLMIAELASPEEDGEIAYRILGSTDDTEREDERVSLGPCPATYTDGSDGNCYKVYTNLSNYHVASNQCKSEGGMLVSIHNEQKNNMIEQMAEQAGLLIWLGVRCPSYDHRGYWSGQCLWEDGQPSRYTRFLRGNPDTQIGECVLMMIGELTKGKWASADCDHMRAGYICQVARKELCGDYLEYAKGAKCYKKIYRELSHDQAELYCQNECGHLTSIHNAKENNIVRRLFNEEEIYARIGLRLSDGIYSWADNSTFDYNNLAYNNTALGECVAMSVRDELIKAEEWINVDCNIALPFVCQRERGACFNITTTPNDPVIPYPLSCDEPQYLEQNGTIYSPQYPLYYRNSKACYYLMITSPGNLIKIHFSDIDLGSGGAILIYNAFTDAIPSERITAAVPSTKYFTSTTNAMKVVFIPGDRHDRYGNEQRGSRWTAVFDSKKDV